MDYEEEYQRQVELVKAQREAYVEGAVARESQKVIGYLSACKEARYAYPMPRRTRPRVVDTGIAPYRVMDGSLCVHSGGSSWRLVVTVPVSAVAAVADPLAHPTEEVPCDE